MPDLNLKSGILSVDDSLLDKSYRQFMALVGHFWSGKHHRTVKSINLIPLTPIATANTNRLIFVAMTRRKTKPRMTISRACRPRCWRGSLNQPALVTGDSGYSCVSNLKLIKNHQPGLLFALESGRLVSVHGGKFNNWIFQSTA